MRKLLLVIFLLFYQISLFAPNLNIEERKQHITKCSLFKDITYAISKVPLLDIKKIPIASPVDTLSLTKINSAFGNRFHPILKIKKHHDGIDINLPVGTEIVSTADGYVEKVEYNKYGYGNCIIINHENGYKTRYAHLKEITVKEGDYAIQGMMIGISGKSGMTTGPHLHYEITNEDKPINPITFICNKPSEYISTLKRIQSNIDLYRAIV
jgi:murein DD-endopeptidase MepM/ murein hydrolase activator NlpD